MSDDQTLHLSEMETQLTPGGTPAGPGPASVLGTLLLADLVDSTKLTEELGDQRAMEVFLLHTQLSRDLLRGYDAHEIDRSDGFLFLFNRPVDALRYALEYHEGLRVVSHDERVPLTARVGIHFGEVYMMENSTADVLRGAKPREIEGLAKPFAARMMSLAGPGQTLLSHTAFDLARRSAVGNDAIPPEAQWIAHGLYQFKGMEEPVNVYEVGIPGVAPLAPPESTEKARRLAVEANEETIGWRPAAGAPVPFRHNWVLAERLGVGGFGEVWLARNDRLRERRVFKFCFQADRLRALRREVALLRIIKERLGERDDIVRLYDWNFDEMPFFLEYDYTSGGDLKQYAANHGGIGAISQKQRLAFFLQTARAVEAAHKAGVIHKDIKPSNVLIGEVPDGPPRAKLADFGVGALSPNSTSSSSSEDFAITGLTGTLSEASGSMSGTRLYMAPELLEGKPASVASDIYSLGVLLYQLAIGDFDRALTIDWERHVRNPALAELIASCAAGSPEERPASVEEVVLRVERLATTSGARLRLRYMARRLWRNKLLLLILVIVLVGGSTGIALVVDASLRRSVGSKLMEIRELRWKAKQEQEPAHPAVAVAPVVQLSSPGATPAPTPAPRVEPVPPPRSPAADGNPFFTPAPTIVAPAPAAAPFRGLSIATGFEQPFARDLFHAIATGNDTEVDFHFDYSTLHSGPLGRVAVPPSPNGAPGDTRALRMTANNRDLTQRIEAATVYPAFDRPMKRFLFRFDFWMNYPAAPDQTDASWSGAEGATEIFTFGAARSFPEVPWRMGTNLDGFFFTVCNDGKTENDFTYREGTGRGMETLDHVPNWHGAEATDSSHEAWIRAFPSPPYRLAGAPGHGWTTVEMVVEDRQVHVYMTTPITPRRLFGKWETKNPFPEGLIPFITYGDPFPSIAKVPAHTFGLIDNLVIQELE